MSTHPSPHALQLEGKTAEGVQWIIPITHNPFVIGRSQSCGLQLSVEGVSRIHAEIREQGGQWWIVDCGSTNGTFVNRRRCTEAQPITPGDVLQFASLHFVVAEKSDPTDVTERTQIINPHARQFEQMMKEGAVTPYFQPILRFADLQLAAYELLGRAHYAGLPEMPGALFQIARKLDREIELSQLFRELSFARADRQGLKCPLFFNMLPDEMDVDAIHAAFAKVRQRYPSLRLVMELHESAVTSTAMIRHLRQVLDELGIALGYDDFGSGQARLLELMDAPPDVIKFDISLIHNIHLRPACSQGIVAALVKMAKEAGIQTLAEGVESPEEAETCKQMGFDLVQGFLYGRPAPLLDH